MNRMTSTDAEGRFEVKGLPPGDYKVFALDGFEKRVWAAPHPERPGAIKAQAIPPEIIASLSDATGATMVAFDDSGKRERKR